MEKAFAELVKLVEAVDRARHPRLTAFMITMVAVGVIAVVLALKV